MILALGNFLNQGTFVGDASAFSLNSILKVGFIVCAKTFNNLKFLQLRDVASNRGKQENLLHYLVGVLLDHKPEMVRWHEEIRHAKEATKG